MEIVANEKMVQARTAGKMHSVETTLHENGIIIIRVSSKFVAHDGEDITFRLVDPISFDVLEWKYILGELAYIRTSYNTIYDHNQDDWKFDNSRVDKGLYDRIKDIIPENINSIVSKHVLKEE